MPFGMSFQELRRYVAETPAEIAAPTLRARARQTPLFSTGGRVALAAGGAVVGGVSVAAATRLLPGVGLNALRPGSSPAPVLPGAGEFNATTPDYCNLITNPALRVACSAGRAIFGGTGTGIVAANPCPPGYERSADGSCVTTGLGRYLPGDVGAPDVVWSPVNGRYGAGYSPMAVEQRRLWCPPGYKLGRDEVCYECLTRKERKWDPGTKPFLTGGDVNAIRKAKRLQKKFNRLRSGKSALFPSAARAPRRKGKKR